MSKQKLLNWKNIFTFNLLVSLVYFFIIKKPLPLLPLVDSNFFTLFYVKPYYVFIIPILVLIALKINLNQFYINWIVSFITCVNVLLLFFYSSTINFYMVTTIFLIAFMFNIHYKRTYLNEKIWVYKNIYMKKDNIVSKKSKLFFNKLIISVTPVLLLIHFLLPAQLILVTQISVILSIFAIKFYYSAYTYSKFDSKLLSTNIIFIRHGETEYNHKHLLQGSIDIQLNDTGREQAYEVSKELVDFKIDKIISSPLRRALSTATVINSYLNITDEIIINEEVTERNFGEYEGKDASILLNPKWQSGVNVEKNVVLKRRARKFLTSISKDYNNDGKTILVVTHSHFMKALMNLLNPDEFDFNTRIKNCEFIHITKDSVSHNFYIN